ncbi:uncharacterized protein LOC107359767 [Tetranychus urticae]|uniref:Uncharacterized protein n=1 Tax=Tetranychus urticae TaxID=32264 RepID=T1K2E0_TETUR|nr:uncharacterized protein LOC107359767 [Tetranychus urticae]
MESNETPDKITIKIKVGGEDYHDLSIDWSDREDVGRQIFPQLASIIGIPIYKMNYLVIQCYPDSDRDEFFRNKRNTPNEYYDFNRLKILNDGDCYALGMYFENHEPPFHVNLELYNRSNFDENRCTAWYCPHINGRDFLNRRVEIIKYGEPKFGEFWDGDATSTIRSMGIQPYMDPICSSRVFDRPRHPYYPRTHG